MVKLDEGIFAIEDDELLEKCNHIWNKVSCSILTEFFLKRS